MKIRFLLILVISILESNLFLASILRKDNTLAHNNLQKFEQVFKLPQSYIEVQRALGLTPFLNTVVYSFAKSDDFLSSTLKKDIITCFHNALAYNNLKKTEQILLRHPSCIDAKNALGLTPLTVVVHSVTKSNEILKFRAVRLLLKHGANPNGEPNFYNLSPLFCASSRSLSIVKLLLASKTIKVNQCGHLGYTSLDEAVSSENKQIAQALIAAGAKRNIVNLDQLTALDLADLYKEKNPESPTVLKSQGRNNKTYRKIPDFSDLQDCPLSKTKQECSCVLQ